MYAKEGQSLIAIVGKDYGSGSSRDWAAKGPFLLVNKYIAPKMLVIFNIN